MIDNIRFPGQYYDKETERWDPTLNEGAGGYVVGTGLHYNRFRYYDPKIGRYISADPIGQYGLARGDGGVFNYLGVFPELAASGALHGGNANLYGYALNQPTGRVDPLGLYSCTYSISRQSMSCRANNPSNPDFSTDDAVSGRNTPDCPDCQNNPDRTGVPFAGPTPTGAFSIGPQRDNSSRRPLTPLPGTDLGGRDSFQTHGCSNANTCSAGCVAFTTNSARDGFNNAMSREEGNNTLTVVP